MAGTIREVTKYSNGFGLYATREEAERAYPKQCRERALMTLLQSSPIVAMPRDFEVAEWIERNRAAIQEILRVM